LQVRASDSVRAKGRTLRKVIVLGVVIFAGAAGLALAYSAFAASARQAFAQSAFTKSIEIDRSTYYRLKVSLAYRGEPQDFDIVVGCNVRQINYKDNSRTLEVGLIPSVFGRRMSDGKGLVVRPPRACRGETTAKGQVPADLLPVVVVYDDADTLAFGTAYLSEDAYESPLSVLKFGGASIERANASEFEAFRREQPNLVQPASYHTPSGLPPLQERGLMPAVVPMGTGCYAYARFKLVGDQLQHARAMWPADRPRYWRPTRPEDIRALIPVSPLPPTLQTDHDGAPERKHHELAFGLDNEVANRGMPTRRGGGVIRGQPGGAFPDSYYPDIGPWITLPWPSDPPARAASLLREGPKVGASVDVRDGQTRGFAYCRPIPADFPTEIALGGHSDPTKAPTYNYVRFAGVDRVDGLDVVTVPLRTEEFGFDAPAIFVERDELIFLRVVIGLQSTRGDV
jgi:hypothetical protein